MNPYNTSDRNTSKNETRDIRSERAANLAQARTGLSPAQLEVIRKLGG